MNTSKTPTPMKIKTPCKLLTCGAAFVLSSIAYETSADVIIFQNGSSPTAGYSGNDVARLEERAPIGNFGDATEGLVGTLGTADSIFHTVLSFDLSDIPAGATINSVTLGVYETTDAGSASSAVQFNLHELTQSFVESEVSWDNYSTGNAWTTPGGDYDSTILSSLTVNPNTTSGMQTFATSSDFVTIVQSALDGSQTLNLLLKLNDTDEAGSSRYLFRFRTDNFGTAADRPMLTIDYTAIPEPASTAFLVMGGIGLFALRRRLGRREPSTVECA
ncbi:DNRLRE domain-containing protein [Cerasicoccus frondis]|uniref:DNRLRE domain-containing protein n=1 Tax=Cerasicoccus frondis TaxID=490090 RepID=UPI0028527C3C|nr:DNRLRE domain-containing protein [Cerasicoccus frondis]